MYYKIQNDELTTRVASLYGVTRDTFWWKINRQTRIITDEATGYTYSIPQDWDLT